MFTAALLTTAEIQRQPKCPSMDEWIRKCGTYIHKEILLSHRKEWNNAIDSNTDEPRDYHMKWSKSQRERQVPYITYLWNLKDNTNEPIYKTETDSQTERTDLWLPRGRGLEKKGSGRLELARWKLLLTEWINNKILLYNTGNHIQ